MAKKIQVLSIYGAHYYAQCNDCDWTDGPGCDSKGKFRDNDKVRNAIRRHVRQTGHTVILEAGKTSEYSLINE
jgi:hypothetical protein